MPTHRRAHLVALLLASSGLAACGEVTIERPGTKPPLEPQTPEPIAFVEVAVATDRTCALDDQGRVLCWGMDLVGETWGDADLAPARVALAGPATNVALAESYACAELVGGVACWGVVPFEAADPASPPAPSAPALLPGSDGAVDLALGAGRACIVTPSGGVRCWGTMSDPGGCFGPPSAPVSALDLSGVAGARTVSVAGSATCFTRADGTAACWRDGAPLLELGFTDAQRLSVASSDGCFSAGASLCALDGQGRVACRAGLSVEELGEPFEVHDGSPAAAEIVWMGGAWPGDPDVMSPCVRTVDGALVCGAEVVVPADQVAMAWSHACAIEDGALSCWGSNDWGALGVGAPARRAEPALVPGLDHVVSLDVGESHACAARSDGAVLCWGSNATLQRGWTSSPAEKTYHPRWASFVDELSELPRVVPAAPSASRVFAEGRRTCAAADAGGVVCWGQELTARMSLDVPTAIPDVGAATSVSPGDDSESCAVVAGGVVQCWGRGWFGARPGVETIALPAPALRVDGDTYRMCALLETGEVYCWGGHVEGSLGAAGDPLSPKKVVGVEGAIDLSGGCVVTGAHDLVCWSFAWEPELVNGDAATVVRAGVRDVDGPCVVDDGGTVACAVDLASVDPNGIEGFQTIPGVDDATQVAAGTHHACVLRGSVTAGGTVACWGHVAAGRLGDGSRTVYPDPEPVVGAM